MANLNPVQQWLHTVLPPYAHRNTVFADVDRTLNALPSLRPRTDSYTYDDGRTALLLTLQGTLPITFRNNAYNIPVAYWLPHDYPRQPPIVYVTPNANMLVRSGRNVDISGLCKGDYLEMWQRKHEGCNLLALSEFLQTVFSKEPPLYAKPTGPAATTAAGPSRSPSMLGRPAPPPPDSSNTRSTNQGPSPSPSLPNKPYANGYRAAPSPAPAPQRADQYNQAPARPPLPTEFSQSRSHSRQNSYQYTQQSPVNATQPSMQSHPYQRDYSPAPNQAYQQTYQAPSRQYTPTSQRQPKSFVPLSQHNQASGKSSPMPYIPPRPDSLRQVSSMSQNGTTAPTRALTTPVNVLEADDEPPSGGTNPAQPPPPRPTNPEMLNLRRALYNQLMYHLSTLQSHLNSENGHLRALHEDLQKGEPAIRDEMARLEAVRDVCANVRDRMGSLVSAAEQNTENLNTRPDTEVDELVCGTNVVHNQLLDLVAEDNALEDTVYHLGRAFNSDTRTQDELERFLKRIRLLSREQFMKRALINKILLELALAKAQQGH